MKQSGSAKTSFWNYIIKESEALHTIPPEDAAWFIDGMVLIRCLKPKMDWISALIRFIFPVSSITMKLLGFINDTYKVDGIKNMTRQSEVLLPLNSTLQVLNRIYHKVTPGNCF